jgi:hypothetical protein
MVDSHVSGHRRGIAAPELERRAVSAPSVRQKEIWAVTTQHVLQNLALAVVLVCISVSVQVALSLLVVRLFQRLASFVEAHHNYLVIVSGFTCVTSVTMAA